MFPFPKELDKTNLNHPSLKPAQTSLIKAVFPPKRNRIAMQKSRKNRRNHAERQRKNQLLRTPPHRLLSLGILRRQKNSASSHQALNSAKSIALL
jgi:hypothetical protein